MVRIIGSSKIDDYHKVVLEEGVLKSIGVKPGDSVLFYKTQNDSSLCVFKAEGAKVTSECDSEPRNHLKEAPKMIRMFLFAMVGIMALMMVTVAMNLNSIDMVTMALFVLFWVMGLFCLIFTIKKLDVIDAPVLTQRLVTMGGPYSSNRLTGLSKMTDDGYAVSGELYINSLFGANPASVNVVFQTSLGREENILTKCTKSIPGYSVHRMRFKNEGLESGTLIVKTHFKYIGKTIDVVSKFDIEVGDGYNSKDILVKEGPVDAVFAFDESFNSTQFDDTLFDPTDEEINI